MFDVAEGRGRMLYTALVACCTGPVIIHIPCHNWLLALASAVYVVSRKVNWTGNGILLCLVWYLMTRVSTDSTEG